MTALLAWWRARTAREKLLLQVCAALIFAVAAPLWAYHAASDFRAAAAADYAAARQLQANIVRLAAADPAAAGEAGQDLQGKAVDAAQRAGLALARAEPLAQGRLRVVFEPASSLNVYRWIDLVGRRGAVISRTLITRVEAGEEVRAEFELAASP